MTKTLPITEVRQNLPKLVDNAKKKMDEYVITVNGKPVARLMSEDHYESLMETLEIMSDKKLMKSIRQGEKEIAEGKYVTFEEFKKEISWEGE